MPDQTKKEEPKAANTEGESELSNDQLEDASGGTGAWLDTFESFRTLAPAAQDSETDELPLKEDGESAATTDVEYTLRVTDTQTGQ